MLDKKAAVNTAQPDGTTALHWAAYHDDLELVSRLLDAGADVRAANRYGVTPLYREVVESQGVEEAMIPIGGSFVQLLMPLSDETPVGRFLSKNGEGMHHMAFAVTSIGAALEHLKRQGARLVDEAPRVGGRGARIAFVHPADLGGTLIELVELADD